MSSTIEMSAGPAAPPSAPDSSRARVLFVSPTAERTDATNSLMTVLPHLGQRFELAVAAPGDGSLAEALERKGIRFVRLRALSREGIPDLARLVRREGFDLVYANTASRGARNAIIAARLAGAGAICHVRSRARDKGILPYLSLNLSDAVVVISRACAESLRGKVLGRKIHVVYDAIDVRSRYEPPPGSRERLRADLGIAGDRPVAIYVAQLKRRKGQDLALRALHRCLENGVPMDMLFVGALDRDRAYVEALRRFAAVLGVEDHVRFMGVRDDVPALLSIADVYIHLSVEETFGRAIIEAMAAGLPVVALAVDGVAEVVLHGQTGYLVPPGDDRELARRIGGLAIGPEVRQRLGAQGRHCVAARFSGEAAAQRLGEIMAGTLDASPRRWGRRRAFRGYRSTGAA